MAFFIHFFEPTGREAGFSAISVSPRGARGGASRAPLRSTRRRVAFGARVDPLPLSARHGDDALLADVRSRVLHAQTSKPLAIAKDLAQQNFGAWSQQNQP